jgi:hypothetical protein
VSDLDSTEFTYAVSSSGDDIFKREPEVDDDGAISYAVDPAKDGGVATVQITVTDDHDFKTTVEFLVEALQVKFDPENLHVVRCDKIRISGAGNIVKFCSVSSDFGSGTLSDRAIAPRGGLRCDLVSSARVWYPKQMGRT